MIQLRNADTVNNTLSPRLIMLNYYIFLKKKKHIERNNTKLAFINTPLCSSISVDAEQTSLRNSSPVRTHNPCGCTQPFVARLRNVNNPFPVSEVFTSILKTFSKPAISVKFVYLKDSSA